MNFNKYFVCSFCIPISKIKYNNNNIYNLISYFHDIRDSYDVGNTCILIFYTIYDLDEITERKITSMFCYLFNEILSTVRAFYTYIPIR